ncbi:hypothetical protein CTM_15558 [Clostridium tetanomorphum DSM 665]|nr:hypothetical protein CTM_15558 [Clostridium tetanomorphum DSM 665]
MGFAVFVRPSVGFRAVAHLYRFRDGQDILLSEQGLQFGLYLCRGVAAVFGSQIGRQLKGVMPDFIHGIAVLVIAGIIAFYLGEPFPQILFQCGIVFFDDFNITVRRTVGSAAHHANQAVANGGDSRHAGLQNHNQQEQHQPKQ